jgi:glycosyltransferase involved in cell wall biosynthesis
MLVARQFGDDRETREHNVLAPAPPWIGRAWFRLSRRLFRPSPGSTEGLFTRERTAAGWRLLPALPSADVVNLHWVADFFNYPELPRLLARGPVVWTFHDMNVFTGGCHYCGACSRFTAACGACPQLHRPVRKECDVTQRILARKDRIFRRAAAERFVAVCPSRWLAGEARRSSLLRDFDVRVIPGGIDLTEFRPVDRAEARRRFGLPAAAKIILFVAEQVGDPRKGFPFLLQAAEAVRTIPGILLVAIGRAGPAVATGLETRYLGSLDDSDALSAAYSSADVFAIPSLQDNFPNTVIESMACGTPVVGFASGGIAEAVRDGHTGLLATPGDANGLGANLRRILEDDELRRRLAAESRAAVEREYSVRLQAQRYAALYEELLDRETCVPPDRQQAAA